NTMTFALNTVIRRGIAVSVVRIIPVEYSELMTSTPSTPIAICARYTPRRLAAVESNRSCSIGLMSLQRLTRANAINAPMPTVGAIVAKIVHTVDRTERSLVDSDVMAARSSPPRGETGTSSAPGPDGGVGTLVSRVVLTMRWLLRSQWRRWAWPARR